MPADNKLELVVEVDVNKANASIKSITAGDRRADIRSANRTPYPRLRATFRSGLLP